MAHEPDDELLPRSGLERALRAGFAADAPEADAPSVLARLGLAGRLDARVVLRSAPRRGEPPVVGDRAAPAPERGNFRVYGEIARGGMGAILKAHDADLGRDVALKVLHGDHARDGAVLQRFVEEAQIGGQLQHPGVVPVHELGLLADRRPYFAMQLVQGRTLASLLRDRAPAGADLPRLVGVFERVCQTVAYAHARGVIHRDLKPANVMIGDFGEVQVVDWGLAKVLRAGGTADEAARPAEAPVATLRSGPRRAGSGSLDGAVMGTPRYMPPEQARGAVDELDERADVFALGAVLGEILTGQAPYDVGGDGSCARDDTLARAADARLEPCRERLRGSGADPELVAIAADALQPDRADRPRDAGVLAARVRAYLESLDERRRAAELRAAEARGRAEQERRARRLTVALAASVLALVALAAGGWAWRQRELAERRLDTADAVDAALFEADERARAAASGDDPAGWAPALAAVERARAALATGMGSPALAAVVDRRAAAIAGAAERARATRARALREERLLAAIEAVRVPEHLRFRLGKELFYPTDWRALDDAWERVFAAAELPVAELAPSEAAAAIAELDAAPSIAAALDEWALVLRHAGDGEAAARVAEVARRADPHPLRTRLRDWIRDEDVERLSELARSDQLDGLFPATLHLLGNTLGLAGEEELAVRVLRAGFTRYPGDFPVAVSLARWSLREEREEEDARVVAAYRAALALRPENVEVHHELANVHTRAGRLDEAEALYARALALAPDDGHLWMHLGNTLVLLERHEEAVDAMRRAAELVPEEFMPHDNLGHALEQLGRPEEALAPLERAIELRPEVPNPYATRAACLLALGRPADAAEDLRRLEGMLPDEVFYPYRLGFALREAGDLDGARAAWTRARALDPGLADVATMLGELWLEAERPDEALPHLRDAVELTPDDAVARALLGGALVETGAPGEALGHLRRAAELGLEDPALAAEVERWTAAAAGNE